MYILFIIVGVMMAFFGVLLVVSPRTLVRLSDFLNRTLAVDQAIFSRRSVWGVLFMLAGIYLFYRYLTL